MRAPVCVCVFCSVLHKSTDSSCASLSHTQLDLRTIVEEVFEVSGNAPASCSAHFFASFSFSFFFSFSFVGVHHIVLVPACIQPQSPHTETRSHSALSCCVSLLFLFQVASTASRSFPSEPIENMHQLLSISHAGLQLNTCLLHSQHITVSTISSRSTWSSISVRLSVVLRLEAVFLIMHCMCVCFALAAPSKNVELVYVINENVPPTIVTDGPLLRQILNNLVTTGASLFFLFMFLLR